MTVVTIRADRGAEITLCDCFRVNTLSIRKKRPVTYATALHNRFITMAPAAGGRDIRAIDCRLRIGWRQNRTHVPIGSVAIKAGRSATSIINGLSVKTVVVICVRGYMKK